MNYNCRHCASPLDKTVIDLGNQPPSNAYLNEKELNDPEKTYPLKVFLCKKCWLMQLPAHASSEELFTKDYAYFSSTSTSWRKHAKNYVEYALKKLNFKKNDLVVELASNDGYLLEYILEKNISCIGIEPTEATAKVSKAKGIKTIQKFFCSSLAKKIKNKYTFEKNGAKLIIANNVVAHVPDINDFMLGVSILLKKTGQASIEFPHILNLIKGNQFDTIYHEHYSYYSLYTFKKIAEQFSLKVIDVEKIPTHGGSLRVWLTSKLNTSEMINKSVEKLINEEVKEGLISEKIFDNFQKRAEKVKLDLLQMLINFKLEEKKIIGYGAAAKGNTLLNFCGIKNDLLPAIIDKAESKQGKYTPGSKIPILSPNHLDIIKPDYILVLPWNIIDEIQSHLTNYELITAIPTVSKYI